jgi:acetyl esterase
MALDPQAEAFLKQAAEAGAPPLESLTVSQAREFLRTLFGPQGAREPIKRVEDRMIDAGGARLPVRIFTPEGAGPLPLLVFFHGGGWVLGDCESYDTPCRALANAARCIVVSVEYRLAPEHKFPTAPEDCYAATLWTVRNAPSLGGDPSRVAIGGDSAGGNLTAVVAQMARDRGAPPLLLQVLVYPVTNHALDTPSYRANADGYLLTRAAMEWFWNHYLREAHDGTEPYASPLRATNFANLPPALLITAEYDPLRDEGAAYGIKLREAGVRLVHSDYPGMIHGFFSLGQVFRQTRELYGQISAELRRAFGS